MIEQYDSELPKKCEPKLAADGLHHHRGKSSESLLDKNTILRELNIQKGQILLDAGCGNGYLTQLEAILLIFVITGVFYQ